MVVELESGGPMRATSCSSRSAGGRTATDLGSRDGRPRAGQADRGRRPDARPDTDWLYAIGDVNGRALLTHMGKYQARIAADAILGQGGPCLILDGRARSAVTFTDPQVAAVGYTLAAAQEAGINARAVDVATQASAGASFYGRDDAPGTSRLVVDEDARPGRRRDIHGPGDRASGCRPRPSRWSARCRSSGSPTPCRPSRRAARSGST